MNQDNWILFEDLGPLHLGLVCRWGVVPSQKAFFTFGPKKVHVFCSCVPPGKNCPVFILEWDRPCLEWQSIWFLTSWPNYDLSNHSWNEDKSVKFDFNINFIREICNVPFDSLTCPLQIINDIEPLSSTLNGLNACFIHQPPSKKWQFWLQCQFFQSVQLQKKLKCALR